MILAISAILAANISAQDVKAEKAECKKECKKEFKQGKKLSCEERIEFDIKYLTEELYLSEEQAAKFAVTYREYKAEQAKLNERFKAKFAKDLNERQVKAVLHYHGPKHHPGEKAKMKGEPRKVKGEQGKVKGEKKRHAR